MFEEKLKCCGCGIMVDRVDQFHGPDGKITCISCFKKMYEHHPISPEKYCKLCGCTLSVSGFCLNRDCPMDSLKKQKAEIIEKPLKLHLGCGNRYLENWINIDKDRSLELPVGVGEGDVTDLKHIILVGTGDTSIDDYSVDEIYASHVLDHLSRNGEVDKALAEWYRVLKPGGILRVAVSDFEKVVKMYNEGLDLERLWGHIVGGHKTSFDKHGCCFDFKLLKYYLEKHGFKDVKRYRWQDFLPKDFDDLSRCMIPRFDFDEGYCMSLNMECTK